MKSTLRMMLTGVCCAICCNGMMSATTADARAVRSDAVRTLSQMLTQHRQEKNRRAASSAKALPGRILKYDWQNGSWGPATVIMRDYTPEGRLSRESGADAAGTVIRETVYTYDTDGNIKAEEESLWNDSRQMLMPATRTGYEYDTVVKDFCIKKVTETYNGAGWVAGTSEGCRVTRNGQGNVTEVVYSEDGEESEKLTMEYGADGKASRITGYEYEAGWKLASKYYDIDSYDDEEPVTDADFVNLEKYEFQEYATSGITEVTTERRDDDVLYDLSGRRIARPNAGQPYIKNGRKYIGK